jgi:hypothetical protein
MMVGIKGCRDKGHATPSVCSRVRTLYSSTSFACNYSTSSTTPTTKTKQPSFSTTSYKYSTAPVLRIDELEGCWDRGYHDTTHFYYL